MSAKGMGASSGPPLRRLGALVVPTAVSLLLVWLLLRGLSWESLVRSVLSASPWPLFLYALLALAGIWLRALRFRMALPLPRPGMGEIFGATAVQNALGDLVPARLASLGSYVWIMSRRLAVAGESAAATFAVSFILDLLTLGPLLLLAVALRLNAASGLPLGWIAAFAAFFFAASAAAAWWLGPLTQWAARLPRALARGREEGAWGRSAAFLERVASALAPFRRGGLLARLFAVSLAIRLAKYGALYALTESLLVGAGIAAPHPDLWDLVIGVSATELVATLPIPALGQFGVWEGGMIGALVMMGFAREPAALVAFGVHGITTAFEYLVGLLAFAALILLARRKKAP
jgi:uncharacterized membrane protein YbhN (UPF0104 family)